MDVNVSKVVMFLGGLIVNVGFFFHFDFSPSNSFMLVDLQDGELIHGENFSLFGAMSALEVSATLFLLLF